MGLQTAVTVVIICCNLLLGLNVASAARQLPDTEDGTGSNVGASLGVARPIFMENSAETSTVYRNFRVESVATQEKSAGGTESPVPLIAAVDVATTLRAPGDSTRDLNAPGDGGISPDDAVVTEVMWSSKEGKAEEDLQVAVGRNSIPNPHQIPQSQAESARRLQSLTPASKGQMCRFGGSIMPIPCRPRLVCVPASQPPSPSPGGGGPRFSDFATLGTCESRDVKHRSEANIGELCRSGGAYAPINCANVLLCVALPTMRFGFGPVRIRGTSGGGGPLSERVRSSERIWASGVNDESVGVCQHPGR